MAIRQPSWREASKDPHFFHMTLTALMGHTADHLRDEHDITPVPAQPNDSHKLPNVTMHYRAHREAQQPVR